MAVYKDGIVGPFKGRVGNVVGYRWRGQYVMRSLPKPKKRREPTEKQKANQARLGLMQTYLGLRIGFIRKGFSLVPEVNRMSPFNVAMSYNMKNAIIGEYPELKIDYSKVVFSRGDLPLAVGFTMNQEGDTLRFSWDTRDQEGTKPDDQVMIMLSGEENLNGKHNGCSRAEGTETINIEGVPPGTELFVHVAFISDNRQRVSDSLYLGSLIVE